MLYNMVFLKHFSVQTHRKICSKAPEMRLKKKGPGYEIVTQGARNKELKLSIVWGLLLRNRMLVMSRSSPTLLVRGALEKRDGGP